MSNKKTRTKVTAGGRGEKPATAKRGGNKPYSAYKYLIGIDPGVNTGFSLRQNGVLKKVETVAIHDAIAWLADFVKTNPYNIDIIMVRVEDARLRKWFGNSGREQLQGAGSIKRDCSIWEGFLTELGVAFELVAPKNNKTKLNAEAFKKITGWEGRTNEHSRDAAMLVFGL